MAWPLLLGGGRSSTIASSIAAWKLPPFSRPAADSIEGCRLRRNGAAALTGRYEAHSQRRA